MNEKTNDWKKDRELNKKNKNKKQSKRDSKKTKELQKTKPRLSKALKFYIGEYPDPYTPYSKLEESRF